MFNAATALGVEAKSLVCDVDSVTFCLSKGLCAPVGSILCGSHEFIERARRVRKSLGGGMRQVGVLAAAGIIGLNEMTERLNDDHAHARRLAVELAGIPGIRIDPERVQTNIVHFELGPDAGMQRQVLVDRLRDEHRIWLGTYPTDLLRAVTHYWIGDDEVDRLVRATREILATA